MNTMAPISAARNQRGLSLIELMISITIGLVLLVAFTSLIVQQNSTRDEMEKSSQQIENGRYAMQILHDDIEHAGFYGTYAPGSGVVSTLPADPCVTAFGSANSGWDTAPISVPVPIYGYPGAASDPMAATTTCGLTNYQPNTAILVIRRTTTTPVAASAVVAGSTYIQAAGCNTDPSAFVYGTGGFTLKQKDCSTLATVEPYIVDIYYISSCDVCGADTIPTLKMVQRGPSPVPAAPIPLVEGIENLQFDYGIDSTGDGAPDNFVVAPDITDLSSWQNVMAVRVNLLARNTEPTSGYTDTKTYTLGLFGAVGPFASGVGSFPQPSNYKRHLYSELVRVINPSGRREKP